MNRKLKTLIILVILSLIWSLAAPCLAKELDEGYFENLFFQLVEQQLPWPAERIVITRFAVEPRHLSLPEDTKEVVRLKHRLRPGSNTLIVDYLSQGKLMARVRMLGYVEVMLPVVVLKRPLPRQALIRAEDLALEDRPLTRLAKDVILDPKEAIGLQTRVSLRAGAVLRKSVLERPPVVKRGSLVRIVAQGKNFTVSAIGEARQNGRIGEIIRVRNLSSKREIFAQVVDQKTVRVTF